MKNFSSENSVSNQLDQMIPIGYSYKEGSIEDGYVIEDSNGNEYVLIPGGYNTDGEYIKDFWISRYEISRGKDDYPQSMRNKMPWVDINFYDASKIAESINGKLISREQYSRICKWLVRKNAATFEQVYDNGKGLGYYSREYTLEKTGSNDEWMFCNIFDFFGNGYIWTTERSELYDHNRVIRGGHSISVDGEFCNPPTARSGRNPKTAASNITFRIVLSTDGVEEDN